MVLKDEIEFESNFSNTLEDVRLLQMVRIRAVAIEDVMVVNLSSIVSSNFIPERRVEF